jgi:Mrp family chromosome partitioning ATPase
LFGITPAGGWVDWLELGPSLRISIPNGIVPVSDKLDLLPAGRSSARPTELLDQLGRREILKPLLERYDLIIFDTPPAAVFPDALMLARCCHEMIYVCRYRTVQPTVVSTVLGRFQGTGVSLLGIVLNQLPENKARNYGYHGYGTQAADYYKAYEKQAKV